ncbi:hypothetical protein CDAR_164881, partial [Caerostris darwini]
MKSLMRERALKTFSPPVSDSWRVRSISVCAFFPWPGASSLWILRDDDIYPLLLGEFSISGSYNIFRPCQILVEILDGIYSICYIFGPHHAPPTQNLK